MNKPLLFPSGDKRSYGLIEIFLASLIFYSPNFLFFFDFFRDNLNWFMLYDFGIIFVLVSTLAHQRFSV